MAGVLYGGETTKLRGMSITTRAAYRVPSLAEFTVYSTHATTNYLRVSGRFFLVV